MPATILVVEDDPELRENMESYLVSKGYHVITSVDGWSCLKEIVVKRPDIILMDVNMPKLNGLNALDLIKVTRLSVKIPIIVMSAKSDAETIQKALELGADDFIEKPFSYEKAASLIDLQLISLGQDTLKAMLSNLRSPASPPDTMVSGSGSENYSEKYDFYPVMHQGMEINLLLVKGLTSKEAAKLSKEKLSQSLLVFAKGEKRWRKLFPLEENTPLKNAA